MYPYCFETSFSFQEFFLLRPLGTAVTLIALGALLLGLWIRLKRWWRLIPVVMVLALVGLAAIEPIKLSSKMAAADNLLADGKWRGKPRYSPRGTVDAISAYAVDLGSKCNSGFLVSVGRSMHTDTWGFTGGYPNSPAEARFQQLQPFVNHSDRYCHNRAEASYGEDWRMSHPGACNSPAPPMTFFHAARDDERGFEMAWCRRLGDRVAYCEASAADVFLASGGHF